jgi:hypothetical protein
MALPGSGPLSFSAIAGELGITSNRSLRNMSDLAGFNTPDSASEFYNYDISDTQRYINAVFNAGFTDVINYQQAIEDLFDSLDSYGLYSKIYGFYPMIGTSAAAQRINAKSSGSIRQSQLDLNFFGGWNFNYFSNMSATGNGSNTVWSIDFAYNSSSIENSHFGVYIEGASGTDYYGWDIGVYNDTTFEPYVGMSNIYRDITDNAISLAFGYNLPNGRFNDNVFNEPGASSMMSHDSGTTSMVQNGASGGNIYRFSESTDIPSTTVVAGGIDVDVVNNFTRYTDKTFGFITFGELLTESEMEDYQLIINQFQTDVGRNIY